MKSIIDKDIYSEDFYSLEVTCIECDNFNRGECRITGVETTADSPRCKHFEDE